ncbi:molybdenum cofactor guanylyltransferase [Candidatus Methanoliparum sp. LAM-1]|nr:molybdenum cofactor guanylyltransferase [Candidatus Methanoliparum sp. LAM-1]
MGTIMDRTGIVLAGGKSLRLGIDKSFIKINGRMLIELVVQRLTECVSDLIVVVDEMKKKEDVEKVLKSYNISIVVDSVKDFGPVAGIYEGLKHAKTEYCGVFATDLPFLNKDLINFFFQSCKGFDAAITVWNEKYREPLHAVYRRDPMMRACKVSIDKNSKKIFSCVKLLKNVNYIPIELIKKIDPELKSFFNINTKEDINLIRQQHRLSPDFKN